MDLKKLYKQFCRRTGRDYFNNYSEMVTNLNLNPNSSRKTNLNIVNRYCKIKKDKWKIYLYDFVTPKQSRKESKKISLKRYSYNSLGKYHSMSRKKQPASYFHFYFCIFAFNPAHIPASMLRSNSVSHLKDLLSYIINFLFD